MPLDFKEKLGPLPVWAWGAIGGGVIIVGYYLMNRGGSAVENVTGSSTLDASGYQTSGMGGVTNTTDTGGATYDTNALWLTRAARQTAELAGASVTDVYNALKKFLAGEALTTKEKGFVDTATKNTGLPPEGTDAVSPVTPDKPPVTTPARFPTNNKQWYVTTSTQAAKYLYDSTKGKIVGGAVDPITWAGLRAKYSNNIDVRIVPASSIAKWRK